MAYGRRKRSHRYQRGAKKSAHRQVSKLRVGSGVKRRLHNTIKKC